MTDERTASDKSRGPYASTRARAQLSEAFLTACLRQFARGGEKAIGRVMARRPEAFIKTLAHLVPKETHITQENAIESMSNEQLADAIASLKAYLAIAAPPPMIDVTPVAKADRTERKYAAKAKSRTARRTT